MRKVHDFFCKLIAELNTEMTSNDHPEKNEIISKLDEAWEMRIILSQLIDWDNEE